MKAEALEVQKYLTDKKDDLALQLDSLVDGYWIAWTRIEKS
ncbi:hypothetical protein [Pseudoalteromonas sp. NGC95]|nr:hypothetical protein [Pseudoalteromonas sp. NGC95]